MWFTYIIYIDFKVQNWESTDHFLRQIPVSGGTELHLSHFLSIAPKCLAIHELGRWVPWLLTTRLKIPHARLGSRLLYALWSPCTQEKACLYWRNTKKQVTDLYLPENTKQSIIQSLGHCLKYICTLYGEQINHLNKVNFSCRSAIYLTSEC